MLAHGTGIAPDPQRALGLYLEAAAQNHAQAQHNAGMMYLQGQGVEADPRAALRWIGAAAAHEHTPSQLELGRLYQSGRGLTQDLEQAAYWYRRAALYGNPEAQYRLALLHRSGQGTTQDAEMERYWLRQAAAQGHARATAALEDGQPRARRQAHADRQPPPATNDRRSHGCTSGCMPAGPRRTGLPWRNWSGWRYAVSGMRSCCWERCIIRDARYPGTGASPGTGSRARRATPSCWRNT